MDADTLADGATSDPNIDGDGANNFADGDDDSDNITNASDTDADGDCVPDN